MPRAVYTAPTAPLLRASAHPRPRQMPNPDVPIRHAKVDIIVFLADDLVVAPNYLAVLAVFHGTSRVRPRWEGAFSLPAEDPAAKVGADAAVARPADLITARRSSGARVLGANMAFRALRALRAWAFSTNALGPVAAGMKGTRCRQRLGPRRSGIG